MTERKVKQNEKAELVGTKIDIYISEMEYQEGIIGIGYSYEPDGNRHLLGRTPHEAMKSVIGVVAEKMIEEYETDIFLYKDKAKLPEVSLYILGGLEKEAIQKIQEGIKLMKID